VWNNKANNLTKTFSFFYFIISVNEMSIVSISGSTLSVDLSKNFKILDEAVASGRKDRNGKPVTHGWIATPKQVMSLNNVVAYLPSKYASEVLSFALSLFDRNVKEYTTWKDSQPKVVVKSAPKKVKAVKKSA